MNSQRLPPHDLDAEASVLSAVMLDRAALDIAQDMLAPAHFYAESNRRIFEAAIDVATRGGPVDLVTVVGALRDRDRLDQVGGASYVAQLVDSVPAIAHIETYANTIREKAAVRSMIVACTSIAAEGYGPIADARGFIDAAGQKVFQIAADREQRDVATIDQVMRESYDGMMAAEARGGAVEMSTAIIALDAKIGGLSRGRLTVVAARPGMGKTSFACGIAENVAASGGPVFIASLEMKRAELGMRMACARAGASVHQGVHGWLHDESRAAVIQATDELRGLPIWIDDTPAITLMRLRAKARTVAARAGRPLSLIVIDYLQLMTSPAVEGRRNRDRELAEITGGLKQVAKEQDCAVLLLSQLNREVEQEKDKRPRLHHLRESGSIEQDADDVLFLYRDEYYHTDTDDPGVVEINVAKQRNGPTGVVRARFHGSSTAFSNLLDA